ncbi:MAG: UDP-glucose/GDP-mannose dehydrogenase family protein [Candidatus Dadabacteria bacterium]|nr:MAG: UDP-glucose/GDP-mannose dehydrogenase family protein [Candidatus Dadabacteria bacterium]
MELSVIGAGYVGLVAAACFADSGNDVICAEVDPKKLKLLKEGKVPIYEPGLEEILKRNIEDNRLRFTDSVEEAVKSSNIIFIAVGTPQDKDGSADLSYVLRVAEQIGKSMDSEKIVVIKSTVPVGTNQKVKEEIKKHTSLNVEVVSNPEFLKEGTAVEDFTKPDRVIIGTTSERAQKVMKELYAPFVRTYNPLLIMDPASAEMSKYAANLLLACRISFINEIANLCEKVGAVVDNVRVGIGTDRRIGMSFLFPGLGYGGSCFPKDVKAIIKTGEENGVPMESARAAEEINKRQKTILVDKLISHYGSTEALKNKVFAVWGLSFKPKTDDVREAPALEMCRKLLNYGSKLRLHDPEAQENFKRALGETPQAQYFNDYYQALDGADALLICTEWTTYRRPNFNRIKERLKEPLIFDGRNIFEPELMKERGFSYYSIGRKPVLL